MKLSRGFTLIELMIVVAIIGVLAMIGIPSYERYIMRSNRSIAKQFLLTVANKQEQYILDARQYAVTIGAGALGLSLTPPAEVATRYTFSITPCATPPCSTYTVTATAIGPQEADGDLMLDNLGQKTSEFADKWSN